MVTDLKTGAPSSNPFASMDLTKQDPTELRTTPSDQSQWLHVDFNNEENKNPFAKMDLTKPDPTSSVGGTLARSAAMGTAPALTGLAGGAAGAEIGAAMGAPLGPIGMIGGGLVGGIVGGIGTSMLAGKAQDLAISKLPDDWRESIETQQRMDALSHPTASFLGGMIPVVATMSPFNAAKAALPANATALDRLMANPVTNRLFGGGMMGGLEYAQEAHEGQPDWTNVAIATGLGMVFYRPNALGEAIMHPAATAAQNATNIKGMALAREISKADMTGMTADERRQGYPFTLSQAADVGVMGAGITEDVFQGVHGQATTAKFMVQDQARTEQAVLGQPKQEDVVAKSRRSEPELFQRYDELQNRVEAFRQNVRDLESPPDSSIQEATEKRNALQDQLDAHIEQNKGYEGGAEARRLRAQLRDAENQLHDMTERREAYGRGEGQETPELAAARKQLMDAEYALRDVAPEVAAAHRRSAEALRAGIVEPLTEEEHFGKVVPPTEAETEALKAAGITTETAPKAEGEAPATPAVKPLEEQRKSIASDVEQQLLNAGRSEEEARLGGQLIAARYITRANRFKGALGTPEELYNREGARIVGEEARAGKPIEATTKELAQIDQAEGGRNFFQEVEDENEREHQQAPIPESVDEAANYPNTIKLATSKVWQKGRDLKLAMQNAVERAAEAAGVDLNLRSPQTTEYLTRATLKDALYALKQNENAIGWYDLKTRQALSVLSLIHPEIATDPNARFAATWALATTSNGIKVGKNFELMEQVYNRYKQTGEMPTDIQAGQAQIAINKSLRLFNELKEKWGIDNLRKFMLSDFTAGEISAIDKDLKPSGEWASTHVKGASILGPKIGNGFFSNLYGHFDALTMDRWLIRTWGRLTGTLLTENPEMISKARGELTDHLNGLKDAERERLSAALGQNLKTGLNDIDGLAENIQEYSTKPENREILNKSPEGTALRLLGNKLAKYLDAQKEAPQGPGERVYIREIFNNVLNELRKDPQYKDMTMADLQAVLWYSEKRLYENAKEDIVPQDIEGEKAGEGVAEGTSAGYADDEAPDYANAAADLARQNGISERRIQAALKKEEERGRAAAARPENEGAQPQAGQQEAVGGFTESEKRAFRRTQAIRTVRSNRTGDAGSSYAYSRRGGGDGDKVRVLKNLGVTYTAEWKAGSALKRTFTKNEIAVPDIVELAPNDLNNATKFAETIQAVKDSLGATGAAVEVKEPQEYQNMRLLMSKDGQSGLAVKPDGDIVSVFSKGGDGSSRALLEAAIAAGGRKLDAFDTVLPRLYADHGFVETGRTKWNDKHAPEEWDKEAMKKFNNGEPDIVFMALDRSNMTPTLEKSKYYKKYDDAAAAQQRFVKKMTEENPASVINLRLDRKDGGKQYTPKQVEAELQKLGVDLLANKVITDENGNPTLVGHLSRPLNVTEGNALSTALNQDAISQVSHNRGEILGPKPEEYQPFDATQFKKLNGEPLVVGDEAREYQQTARGKIRIAEGKKPLITLMKDANASTFIHETGHDFLEQMMRDAEHPDAPDSIKDDALTIRDWLGVDSREDIKTRHHEKFARGFEQYLREGVAPSPELGTVFARFKQWLMNLYETIKRLGSPINEDIRGVFDRMLAEEPQRTVVAPEQARQPNIHDIHATEAEYTEPRDAEATSDRVIAERNRAAQDFPEGVKNEITPVIAKFATPIPAGEAPAGEGGSQNVVAGGGGFQPISTGGRGSAQYGEVKQGGGAAIREGVELPRAEQRSVAATDTQSKQPLAPEPTTQFGSETSPYVDKAGNIRLDTLNGGEDVNNVLKITSNLNNDFIGDRRGVITDGQVLDLADALGMDAQKLSTRKLGQAFNAEQVWAARKLLIQSATNVAELMRKAANGSDADVMAYAEAKDRHQMIQAQVAGITAEAGRALRAFRSMAGEEMVMGTNEFIKQATGKTLFQLREEAKLGSRLETPQQVSKFMQDAQNHSFGRMVLEYWINGLISGLATHTTYMVGNTMLAVQKAGPETAMASLVGTVARALGREGESVRIGELGAQMKGIKEGFMPALKAAFDATKTGVTTLLPEEKPYGKSLPLQAGSELTQAAVLDEAAKFSDVASSAFGIVRGIRDGIISGAELLSAGGIAGESMVGLRYSERGAIPDITVKGVNVLPVGEAIRLPGRFIAGIHSFFRSMNYSMEKNAIAARTAANEGLTGTAYDARVAELRSNPTQEMMEKARFEATELTLMGSGSDFVKQMAKLTNTNIMGFPFLKFIDPFVHIASNVIDQSIIQRTPVGLLAPEIRADLMGKNGNIAQDKAAARMLVGTAMSIAFGSLAAEGLASGSGPSDPKESQVWRQAGNQAHSIRIGDMWYDTHRLGPLGMLMGVSADMYEVAHLANEGEYLDAAAHLQHAFTQNVLDESFMRGPADLLRAVEDPGRYGQNYLKNMISSFVPYSVAMSQMARASDPYSREARTVTDAIKNKIPGLSETLLPRRDIWGEPMPNRKTLGPEGMLAIWETQVSKDPVNLAMLNLGVYPATLRRSIRNVDLTDEQYDEYAKIAGRTTKMRLDTIVKSPDYQRWPDHVKHDVMVEVIKQSREAASGLMMMKYPQIVRDATGAKIAKARGED